MTKEKLYTKQELLAEYFQDLCKLIDKGINVTIESQVKRIDDFEVRFVWEAEVDNIEIVKEHYKEVPECKWEGYKSSHACIRNFIKSFEKILE
mgnify:CR=1 FL=1